ncbi:MAG: hypothetical protein IJ958_02740 [Agathobacter sp.]|nr:hypothetical protein [Agathobacter sp.]
MTLSEASNLGIRPSRAVTYRNDSRGVQLNYSVAGNIVSNLRCNDYTKDEEDVMFNKCMAPIVKHMEGN